MLNKGVMIMDWNQLNVTDVLSIYTLHFSDHGILSVQDRKCQGIVFTDEGQLTYHINGKELVLDRNHAAILPKNRQYTIKKQKEGNFYLINFECNDFFSDTVYVFPVENSENIIREILYSKNFLLYHKNRLHAMSLMYRIFFQLSAVFSGDFRVLHPAIEYLKTHSDADLNNAVLAEKCYISEEYFRKLFKRAYGISPKQYIIEMRINTAKQLLSEGTLKINEIAMQCGFSNPYHFSRLFKEKTSYTPSEFMKRNRIHTL